MTDRPILFSGPMVRAIHARLKTNTRRVLRIKGHKTFSEFGPSDTRGYDWHFRDAEMRWHDLRYEELLKRLPHQVGDRLWVREAWRTHVAYEDLAPRDMGGEEPIRYEADGYLETWGWPFMDAPGRYRQGMHMPRWASRTTLVVTDVRVQRLQEISEEDAIAEGVEKIDYDGNDPRYMGEYGWRDYRDHPHAEVPFKKPIDSFRTLWDSLNAARGYGWGQNPWVTATTYTVHRCNIDQIS